MTFTSGPFKPGDVVVVRAGRLRGVTATVCAVSVGGLVGLRAPGVRSVEWTEPYKVDRVDIDAS